MKCKTKVSKVNCLLVVTQGKEIISLDLSSLTYKVAGNGIFVQDGQGNSASFYFSNNLSVDENGADEEVTSVAEIIDLLNEWKLSCAASSSGVCGDCLSVETLEFTAAASVNVAHNLGKRNIWAVYFGNQLVSADITDDGTNAVIDFGGSSVTGTIQYLKKN